MVKTNTIYNFEEYGIINPNKAAEVAEYVAENNTEDDDEDKTE